MKIISRYVLKEHVGPLVFSLTALTSLLLLNYIAKQFGDLVGKGLPWSVIGEFFVLSIPFTVAMTLPMAVLVAVLYAFSRLAAENEITALKASGVSLVRVLVPVLWGAFFLAVVMIWFNDQVLPRANHQLRVLQSDILRKKPTFALKEQVINEVSPGKLYLRAGHLDRSSSKMREVVIYNLSDPTKRQTIYADSGTLGLSPSRTDLDMMLFDGYMQTVPTSDPAQLQRLFYKVDRVRVPGVANQLERSTDDNFKSEREMSICEMEREYEAAERSHQEAYLTLRQALENAAYEAATGIARPSRPPTVAARPYSVGGLYCRLVDLLTGRTSGDSTGAEMGIGLSALGARLSAPPLGTPPSPQATQSPQPRAQSRAGSPQDTTAARRDSILRLHRQALAAKLARIGKGGSAAAERRAPSAGNGAAAQPPRIAPVPPQPLARSQALPLVALSGTVDASRARLLDTARSMDTYAVEIQKKFALAAACVVFVLLGAPVALRFPRGGVGLTIGVSLSVFSLYYVALIAGEELADRGLMSPFWSMWAANILFTAVGLVFLARMGREASTARGGDVREMLDAARSWLARQARRVGIPMERRRRTT